MTAIRARLEALLADGHARRQVYLAALAVAPDDQESALVALVLGDPDRVMAEAAMVSYVDSQASRLHSADTFAAWAAGIASMVQAAQMELTELIERLAIDLTIGN